MRMRARKGEEAALARELCELAQRVRELEPDCLLYRAARSQHDERLFIVLEHYRDADALAAHANSEHYRDAVTALLERLEERPEIALFDAIDACT
ncbi:MAG: antibiotic biosynthesis monooxygenase [Myxococcales bacterium]|nr:antibiotic biosynthesis monooxygenase [Myxococcales bacterium]